MEKDKAPEEVLFQEKPQICLIDIEDEIKDNLTKKGLNVESGTLGKAIKVPNKDDLIPKITNVSLIFLFFRIFTNMKLLY